MIANLGYTFTIARHDSTILTRSLIAVPVFLLRAHQQCSPNQERLRQPLWDQ